MRCSPYMVFFPLSRLLFANNNSNNNNSNNNNNNNNNDNNNYTLKLYIRIHYFASNCKILS